MLPVSEKWFDQRVLSSEEPESGLSDSINIYVAEFHFTGNNQFRVTQFSRFPSWRKVSPLHCRGSASRSSGEITKSCLEETPLVRYGLKQASLMQLKYGISLIPDGVFTETAISKLVAYSFRSS
jgi:hypothetical protein